jgi:hypothetical protein
LISSDFSCGKASQAFAKKMPRPRLGSPHSKPEQDPKVFVRPIERAALFNDEGFVMRFRRGDGRRVLFLKVLLSPLLIQRIPNRPTCGAATRRGIRQQNIRLDWKSVIISNAMR